MKPPADTTCEPGKRSASSGAASTVIRAAVSVAALALVLGFVDVSVVIDSVRRLDVSWLLAAFGAVVVAIVLSAFKWSLLLASRGRRPSLLRLTRHYYVGLFFNNFLPTSVGGDVVRAWDCGKDVGDMPEGAASVIAERLIASFALGLTALIGVVFAHVGTEGLLAAIVVTVFSAVLGGVFLVPSLSERMMKSAMGRRFEGVCDWIARASDSVGAMLRRPSLVLTVLALSVVFQMCVAAVNYSLFAALGWPVGFAECVLCTSIVSAVTMVPVSVSGHGIREAGYAYFFGLVGVSSEVAVTASLLFFAVVALSTLPGAALFVLGREARGELA